MCLHCNNLCRPQGYDVLQSVQQGGWQHVSQQPAPKCQSVFAMQNSHPAAWSFFPLRKKNGFILFWKMAAAAFPDTESEYASNISSTLEQILMKTLLFCPLTLNIQCSMMQSHFMETSFHRSCPSREGWLKRSVSGLLAGFPTCQHMVARQTHSSRTKHLHRLRGIEVVADCHLVFSYSYAAASEHMPHLTTPPSSLSLQLCFFLLLRLFLSLSLHVCLGVMWTCTSVCIPCCAN